ncbi:nuclear body protein SP140-like protein isoform X2 [Alosa sapidissima]|uniref:nuclear body protein SP140-like protein isoform X2 n=1 Tax=Alosa sapidissima TaxID=34773 RepID=UPI001C08D33C|nr:nuclear body protein SP140-like protein isoform X2 [Alosa sapidissima]
MVVTVRAPMDPLDFLTQDQLLLFFRRKKTEMSCMDQPHTFLTQLRDHDLLSEKLYQRVVRMKTKEQKKKGVYEVLDSLETHQPECVETFWRSVFTDHIMQLYPTLRLLRNSLMDGSFPFNESHPEVDCTSEEKDAEEKSEDMKERKVKKRSRQKSKGSTSEREEEEEQDQAGTSQVKTSVKKRKLQKPIYALRAVLCVPPVIPSSHSLLCCPGSPLIKGGREDIWNWPMFKTQLPVTCGNKEGTLYRDKLAKGVRSIFHEDRWYTPGEFEKLGGKERSKNWKTSIRCRNTPLQKLIQENHLTSSPAKRRSADRGQDGTCMQQFTNTDPTHVKKKMRRALFPSSPENSIRHSSDEENSSSNQTEDRSEGDLREEREEGEEEEGGMAGAGGAVEGGSNHDNGEVDTSLFEGSTLPVQCGPVTGRLQKDRFASGSTGKCIRTDERWLTPAEFIRLNPDLMDGMWKRDITCRGQPLSYLLQGKILQVHSLLCMCRMCSHTESDLQDQTNDDHCFICGERGELLCCDGCPRSFHRDCHIPTPAPSPGDDWLCTFCVWKRSQEWRYADHMTQKQVLDSRISVYTLQCQYLLLFLLNADEQRIFTIDPCPTVSGYSSVIPRPMWLQKVRENLESRYRLVGEFVSDVRLIFRNCAVFNRNNQEIKEMGIRLSTLFEEEFQSTFIATNQRDDSG